MTDLIAQTVVLLIAVCGGIVSVLAPTGHHAKRRWVLGFVVLGIIDFVFIFLTFEKTVGVPTFELLGTSITFAVSSVPFRLALLFCDGLILGALLVGIAHRAKKERPVVKNWLSPLQAIEVFVDGELQKDRQSARDNVSAQSDQIQFLKSQISRKARSPLGSTPASQAPSIQAPPLREQLGETLIQRNKWSTIAELKKMQIDANLIELLKSGKLVAKALRTTANEVSDKKDFIAPALWSVLTFDPHDSQMETVSNGKRKYRGLEIGLNENPK